MKTVRIGIVGCGAAAQRYYVAPLKRYPDLVRNIALVDRNIAQADALAQHLGGGKIYSEYKDIIDKVDGVIISLPHFLHAQVATEFLQNGVHVLCEKPLAENYSDACRMVDVASTRNVSLCVNNTRRLFPSFRSIKKLIDNGTLGKIKHIRYIEGNVFAWPSSTGFYVDPKTTSKGVLLDLGPHILDIISWWLDGVPEIITVEDDSFGGPESVTQILAKYNGCKIDIFVNRLLELQNSYSIVGELGSVEGNIFDWNNYKLTLNNTKKDEIVSIKPIVRSFPDFVIPVIDNFINVVNGSEKPLVAGEDVVPSIRMIEDCYMSRKSFHLPWLNKCKWLADMPIDGKILVTGATGFIGCRVVELLHLGGKHKVKASIRRWSSAARLGRFPVEIVLVDLMHKNEIEKALEDVTYVIHCAKGEKGATEQGTRNLLEVCKKNNIKKIVYLSTAEVYGNAEGLISENAEYQYTGNEYNKTKIDAEKVCWEFIEDGLPITILRPAIVYGPFSKNWIVNFAQMFLRGKGKLFKGNGEGYCNLIYTDDLVRAIVMALSAPRANGKVFNVVGPDIISWNEYFKRLNKSMGLPPLPEIDAGRARLVTQAIQPLRLLGRYLKNNYLGAVKKMASASTLADFILRRTESSLKATPCIDELKLYSRKIILDASNIEKQLGFKAGIGIEEGLGNSRDWLKHNRLI